ncbi:MAG: DUF2341 domain-containing protein [Thermoanaerobaculia bacterium]
MKSSRAVSLAAIALTVLTARTASAQPAGWSQVRSFTVTENSGAALSAYQVSVTIDTATPIAAGQMRADAGDLRFGPDVAGTSFYPYWIESGVNTASTMVWVAVPSIPASSAVTVYAYWGNAGATSAATLAVFDGPHSSTDQVASGGAGGATNSQRGFRFSPNVPILVTEFGKREPNGTTRYVTLFNYATQAIVAQTQVAGLAAQYSYQPLANPFWLSAGTQYVLELYQGASDGYYFGTSSQINANLTYYDMRYCNSCTQDTFPTNVLSNYHYGYPDLNFYTRQIVTPAPTVSALVPIFTPTTTTLSANPNPPGIGLPVTLTATVSPSPGAAGTVQFLDGGVAIAGCSAVPVAAGVATCTTPPVTAGSHPMTAVYSGGGGFAGSTSAVLALAASEQAVIPVLDGAGLAALAGLVAAAGALALARRPHA